MRGFLSYYKNNTVGRDYRRVSFYIGNFAERRILRMASGNRVIVLLIVVHFFYITNTFYDKVCSSQLFYYLNSKIKIIKVTQLKKTFSNFREQVFHYMGVVMGYTIQI